MSNKTVQSGPRVIKRYSNRKLYDTQDSRYVTLQQIGEMVRRGEDVRIIDNKTKEDKTEVTLALILSEDLKNKPRSVPLGTLRNLIQERGERFLSQLRDGPIGRLIPGEGEEGAAESDVVSEPVPAEPGASELGTEPAAEQQQPSAEESRSSAEKAEKKARSKVNEFVESSKHTWDQLQANLDEKVKTALVPGLGTIRELSAQVESLTQRVKALEAKLGESEKNKTE